jgi:hypothetical protein
LQISIRSIRDTLDKYHKIQGKHVYQLTKEYTGEAYLAKAVSTAITKAYKYQPKQ